MTGAATKAGITAVTVTYGDRWCYLEVLLRHLEDEELVCDVVVVDNASKKNIAESCVSSGFTKARVIRQAKNLGSAGGYKIGIESANALSNDYIMLYDDDVVTSLGSLERLLHDFTDLTNKRLPDTVAIMAYRESQHGKLILRDHPYILADHHFLGLNIFNFFQRRLFANSNKLLVSTPNIASQNWGAAYAGLFFHKSLIAAIGLPDPEFVVYYDDVEFTSRLLKKGGEIWLDMEASCEDLCTNYSMGVVTLPFFGYLFADSDAKVFYLIRNRIYFDMYSIGVRSAFYFINMMVFVAIILTIGLLTMRINRLKIILSAIIHGCNGKMGIHHLHQL